MTAATRAADAYDAIADRLVAAGEVEFGTIMGQPCLRRRGSFIATLGHHDLDDTLIVKLSKDRVTKLIADGIGDPFVPSGKVFREWVAISDRHVDRWSDLVDEAVELATKSTD